MINSESNNPAILADKGKVLLIYRNADLRIYIAEADFYFGPYKIVNDNVWPDCKLEDFYLFKAYNAFHLICEDNEGVVSGHVRWGIHLYSNDGVKNWKKYLPEIVYDHEVVFTNVRSKDGWVAIDGQSSLDSGNLPVLFLFCQSFGT